MVFARIVKGAIVGSPDSLGGAWVDPDDGTTYTNLAVWTEADRNKLGWFAVADVPPAYDPATQQLGRGAVTLVGGRPVQQYTVVPLSLARQAQNRMAAGLTIVSAGTPALSATYPCDTVTQAKFVGVRLVLEATGAFPGGAVTWPVKDAAGKWRQTTPAQFTALALAVAGYVALLYLVIDGQSATLPPATATIP